MKMAIKWTDNSTRIKLGFTAEELHKILEGEPKLITLDKYRGHTYEVLLKKISKEKNEEPNVQVKRK